MVQKFRESLQISAKVHPSSQASPSFSSLLFYILQAMESWAGPGNEATFFGITFMITLNFRDSMLPRPFFLVSYIVHLVTCIQT